MSILSCVNIKQGTKSTPRFSNGNTLPLTQRPFAMAGFVPQTAGSRGNWFYHPDDRCLEGVRLTHQPSPWMGDFGCFCLMPGVGEVFGDEAKRWSGYRPEEAVLRPDYMKLEFLRYHAVLELTPTERGAAMRVTYKDGEQPRFSVFPVRDVCGYRLYPEKRRLTGFTRAHSWDIAENFRTYFALEFDCALEEAQTLLTYPDGRVEPALSGEGDGCGCSVALAERQVGIRLAISYISEEQAVENLRQDTAGRDFEALRAQAQAEWEEVLSRIQIETRDEKLKKTFYSCLYRMFLYPNKFHEITPAGETRHFCANTGEVRDGVMYVNNGFWDTFRTVYPLFSIIAPDEYAQMLEGFVNIYRDCGWLPKWPSPAETGMMPGTLIDAVIAHAAVTGVADRATLETALEGMIRQANEEAPEKRYGRKGVAEYKRLGYVPRDLYTESVNATLDYAYSDFCIAQTAAALGRDDVAAVYRERAGNYRHLFDKETGFMRGRDSAGERAGDFNPYRWGGEYCEGSAWQNSFGVYHDVEGLAALYGSREALLARLDELFAAPPDYLVGGYRTEIHEMSEMAAADFGQCAISNQPSFHLPYLYAALGQPEKANSWVERLAREAFSPEDDGFPGDEDNGTTSGWYVFACMGFYPLCPGRPAYIKTRKLVDRLWINGREFDPDSLPGTGVRQEELPTRKPRR